LKSHAEKLHDPRKNPHVNLTTYGIKLVTNDLNCAFSVMALTGQLMLFYSVK